MVRRGKTGGLGHRPPNLRAFAANDGPSSNRPRARLNFLNEGYVTLRRGSLTHEPSLWYNGARTRNDPHRRRLHPILSRFLAAKRCTHRFNRVGTFLYIADLNRENNASTGPLPARPASSTCARVQATAMRSASAAARPWRCWLSWPQKAGDTVVNPWLPCSRPSSTRRVPVPSYAALSPFSTTSSARDG